MPYAEPGEKLSFSQSKFTKLQSKGDKIRFRVIGKPFYDGKHFQKDESKDSGWNVLPCPRINEGDHCDICELYFKALKSAKKDGLDQKETDKLTKDFSASISMYYPVINRDTEEFEIFQTTPGVRNQIEDERKLGKKIEEIDLIVLRTEKPGSYYKLSVVDSSDTKKLSKKEQDEVKKGQATDLSEYVQGQEQNSSDGEVEEDIEV